MGSSPDRVGRAGPTAIRGGLRGTVVHDAWRFATSLVDSARFRPALRDVRTYLLFIGHGRSGHSIVGSLLDAHPEAIVSDELDAARFIDRGFGRDQVLALRWSDQRGRRPARDRRPDGAEANTLTWCPVGQMDSSRNCASSATPALEGRFIGSPATRSWSIGSTPECGTRGALRPRRAESVRQCEHDDRSPGARHRTGSRWLLRRLRNVGAHAGDDRSRSPADDTPRGSDRGSTGAARRMPAASSVSTLRPSTSTLARESYSRTRHARESRSHGLRARRPRRPRHQALRLPHWLLVRVIA